MVTKGTMIKIKQRGFKLKEPNTTEDINNIEHLIRVCATEADGFGIDEFKPDGHFNHRLMHEAMVLLVLDMEDNLLGAVIYGSSKLSRVRNALFTAYFIIKKEARRRGIASLLLAAVADISATMYCDTLLFDVYITNHVGIKWLCKNGFHCTGSIPQCGYVKGQGFTDCFLFQKHLDSIGKISKL